MQCSMYEATCVGPHSGVIIGITELRETYPQISTVSKRSLLIQTILGGAAATAHPPSSILQEITP